MSSKQQREKIYFAVDIESGGPSFLQAFAIGICLGYKFWNVIDRQGFYSIPPLKFHSTTQKWWNNHSDVLKILNNKAKKSGSLNYSDMIHLFCQYLNNLEHRFPENDIVVLSDNPSFDLGALDYGLQVKCNRLPIRYSRDGKTYRCVEDPSARWEMLPQFICSWRHKIINAKVIHHHLPEN